MVMTSILTGGVGRRPAGPPHRGVTSRVVGVCKVTGVPGPADALGSAFVRDLQSNIAQLADRLGLHATAPVLTLGLLTDVGRLADEALAATSFGRRPFRPTDAWAQRLAEVAFTMINLADQTGVDLDAALRAALTRYQASPATTPVADDLPF
jgi:hypothetical protein